MKYVYQGAWLKLLGATLMLSMAAQGHAADAPATEASKTQDVAAYARGAKAWSENCFRCHNAREPKEFRDDQWPVIMQHMRIRAGLTGQETRDILKFLQGSN